MSLYQIVKKRRSVRSFTDRKVSESKIKKILKCATMAPSALGLQSYKIYVIKSKSIKEKLIKATHDQTYVNTDTVLVFCVDGKKPRKIIGPKGENLFGVQDATIAASYAQLAVTAEGLNSIWIGHFDENKVKDAVRTKLRPVCILSIGHSTEKPQPKEEKKISDILSNR